MIILRCKMCGGDLAYTEGSTVCECEYCGSMQTVLTPDSEKKANLFNRANRLRMNSEFDKAQTVYEQIVADFPEEAESYWGLCLCKYGIEYVDDPASGCKMPTCHRTVPTSIFDEPDFENVMEYADSVAKSVYRAEAKEIERVQRRILEIAQSEDPYDVFICYKETDEDGGRTEDSVLAQDLYDALTEKGLKVFFARITLESKLGTEYEPYIYAALSTAGVMLAVGTDYDYFSSVWVKNEWSRYLAMMKTDRKKNLIPCYKGMDAYDLPREFKNLQAQDMGKLGWLQDVTRGVLKLCGKDMVQPVQMPVQQTVVREVVQGGSNAAALVGRAFIALEDGEWEKADEFCEQALNHDFQNAQAYVGKIMVSRRLKTMDDLSGLRKSIDSDPNWQKALRFANPQQKQQYEAIAKNINDNEAHDLEEARIAAEKKAEEERIAAERKRAEEEQREKEEKYAVALSSVKMENYADAIALFFELGDFRDSKAMLDQYKNCFRKQYSEREIAKVKEDPRLTEARTRVKAAEFRRTNARNALNRADNEAADSYRQVTEIAEEIRRCSNALNNLHGLFTGGKKHDLTENLERLKLQQDTILDRYRRAEAAFALAKDDMKSAENEHIAAAQGIPAVEAALAAETEQRRKEIEATLSDEETVKIATAIREARKPFKTIGGYVTWGTYPQTKEGSDSTPIEWLVLEYDEKNNKALLISRYGLDCQPYNSSKASVTWETCSLRAWLNGIFLNKAFSKAEQGAILTTNVGNSKSQCYSGYIAYGGNNTQDKIFLLSYAEANKYFNVTNSNSNNIKSRVAPTAYAIAQGAYTYSSNKTADGSAFGMWWLRSPGLNQNYAAYVNTFGSLYYYYVFNYNPSVRPAMWLDLSKI